MCSSPPSLVLEFDPEFVSVERCEVDVCCLSKDGGKPTVLRRPSEP